MPVPDKAGEQIRVIGSQPKLVTVGPRRDALLHAIEQVGSDDGWMTDEQRRLYDERIYPLMRIWFFERERFAEEYTRRRAEWVRDLPPDHRQLSLFAA